MRSGPKKRVKPPAEDSLTVAVDGYAAKGHRETVCDESSHLKRKAVKPFAPNAAAMLQDSAPPAIIPPNMTTNSMISVTRLRAGSCAR